jgi:hypothetical protein
MLGRILGMLEYGVDDQSKTREEDTRLEKRGSGGSCHLHFH